MFGLEQHLQLGSEEHVWQKLHIHSHVHAHVHIHTHLVPLTVETKQSWDCRVMTQRFWKPRNNAFLFHVSRSAGMQKNIGGVPLCLGAERVAKDNWWHTLHQFTDHSSDSSASFAFCLSKKYAELS